MHSPQGMLVQLPLYDLTELIIAKAIVVHDHFGPGLFETVYSARSGCFSSRLA